MVRPDSLIEGDVSKYTSHEGLVNSLFAPGSTNMANVAHFMREHQEENLLHLGAFARHVGVYPGPTAIEAFAEELESFGTSKGAIQLPHNRDLPVDLVRRIVRWRLEQISEKRPPRAKPGGAPPKSRTPSRAAEAREQTSRPAASPKEDPKAGPSARRTKPRKLLAGGNPQVAS